MIDEIVITEAELRAAIKEIRGDSEMNDTEWKIQSPLNLVSCDGSQDATVDARGRVVVHSTHNAYRITGTSDLRGLIASLQSILVLAEEHFGEDWGK